MHKHLKEIYYQNSFMKVPINLSKSDLQQKTVSIDKTPLDVTETIKSNLKIVKKIVTEINQQIKRSSHDDNCVNKAVKSAVTDIKSVFKNSIAKSPNNVETQLNKLAHNLEHSLYKNQRSIF